MSLSIGIVGLPNVGKSTLFNALLKRQAALAASYPFATIDPNVGIVAVPDNRIFRLEEIVKREFGGKPDKGPQKVTPATIKFIDIAGLVKGAHKGEGLGNKFLAHIREVDAILHVVRDFEDENVDKAGAASPQEDIELINAELLLADLSTVAKRISSSKDQKEKTFLNGVKEQLEKGSMLSSSKYSDDEKKILKGLNLLTTKPFLFALNVGEENLKKEYDPMFIKICAKLEADLISFEDGAERADYLREMGIKNTGLDLVIKRSYELLDLHSFFTPGPDEIRAWTIKKGTKAKQAAGVIHTDFERGFIGAEVITIDKLEEAGTWKQAKDLGQVRLEGKEYAVQDGDIMIVRFNV
ncbi:redox-regulated ATPase YchF [Patescibacteria group bacterium]